MSLCFCFILLSGREGHSVPAGGREVHIILASASVVVHMKVTHHGCSGGEKLGSSVTEGNWP